MYVYAGWVRVIRHARVVSCMGRTSSWNYQIAASGSQIGAHVHASILIVIDHSAVVIPEDVEQIRVYVDYGLKGFNVSSARCVLA